MSSLPFFPRTRAEDAVEENGRFLRQIETWRFPFGEHYGYSVGQRTAPLALELFNPRIDVEIHGGITLAYSRRSATAKIAELFARLAETYIKLRSRFAGSGHSHIGRPQRSVVVSDDASADIHEVSVTLSFQGIRINGAFHGCFIRIKIIIRLGK